MLQISRKAKTFYNLQSMEHLLCYYHNYFNMCMFIAKHQSTSIRKLMHNKCCYFNLGHVIRKSTTIGGITELIT
jgi:hypothetical protein